MAGSGDGFRFSPGFHHGQECGLEPQRRFMALGHFICQRAPKTSNAPFLAGTRFRSVKSGPVKFEISAPDKSTIWTHVNVCEPEPRTATNSVPKIVTPPNPAEDAGPPLPPVPAPGFRRPPQIPVREPDPAFNNPLHYAADLPAGIHIVVVKLTGGGPTAFIGARSDDCVFLGSADQ